MKIKSLVVSLLAALVAVPSLAFASRIDLSLDTRVVNDSIRKGASVRFHDKGDDLEHVDRGRKLGHVFQELSFEARADLKAQLKALHEEFRAKLKALRQEFASKVKALIDAFLEAEAEADSEASAEVNES